MTPKKATRPPTVSRVIRASRPGVSRPNSQRILKAASLRKYFQCAQARVDELIAEGQREGLPCPSVADWARKEGVDRSAPYRWAKSHDFSAALEFSRKVQRDLNELALLKGLKFTLMDKQ
jgi:hypothetical protein